jgi:hypothetical protein
MEIKVREVKPIETKSIQEVENELLEKHEDQFVDSETTEAKVEVETEVETEVNNEVNNEVATEEEKSTSSELREEDILSFIKNKYGRELSSLDEINAAEEEAEELPEDVAAYYKYKKETGRGLDDFVKLNRDIDSVSDDKLLKDYLLSTEEGLDEDDIDSLMEDFDYDEEYDEESDIKKIKIKKKKIVAKAKKFFNEQKEKYKVPLESSGSSNSLSEDEGYQEYKQYVESAKTTQEENQRKSEWFSQKTDEVFSNEFKGFEFKLDDNSVVFNPGDAAELKKIQSNPENFIKKFLDENGMVSDARGYHKSLAVAMNPEKFAQFFYDQGKSTAKDGMMKTMKNINMSERTTGEVSSKGGTQVRSLSNDSGRGLKIRSKK